MFEDARTLVSGSCLDVDLCIVGAGAAGITLARELADGGRHVLLVESGSMSPKADVQSLYEGTVVAPDLHSPAHYYRKRIFGGSTTVWGGRCAPFDPIDFEPRSWLGQPGWPIAYDEIARFYPAANALCEAGDFDYSAMTALPGGMKPMLRGFAPSHFTTDRIERFSRPTNFAARYADDLKQRRNLRVLLNANCVEICPSQTGDRIETLNLRTLNGNHITVSARQVVLAMGGLEIPRLLLASRRRDAGGVGNAHDLVGRYYMSHIAGTIGALQLNIPVKDVWHGYDRTADGVYCRRRITPTPETQQSAGLANIVFRLHHPRLGDPAHGTGVLSAIYLLRPFIAYEYAKRLYDREGFSFRQLLKHGRNIARMPIATVRFMAALAFKRQFAARKFPSLIVRPESAIYSLDVHAEQMPLASSRISLDDQVDPLGMPRIKIDWHYDRRDIESVATALRLLQRDFANWGHGALTYDDSAIEANILRHGAYGGHHIGTTRMADAPRDGVVDRDCRVHGIENLFIASSAVFPSSGQANPTLTIVALALRLADHLKRAGATA